MARKSKDGGAPGAHDAPEAFGRARRPYLRIQQEIRDHILRRELLPGDAMADEDALSKELGAHRFIVRKALSNLVREKVLYRFRGQGDVVSGKLQLEAFDGNFIALLHSYTDRNFCMQGFNLSVLRGVREATGRDVLAFGADGGQSAGEGPDLDAIPWERVEGVMLFSIFREGFFERVGELGLPTVAVDYDDPECPYDCVSMDNFDAGYLFASLQRGMRPEEAAAFANAVAARSCTFVGGAAARSSLADITGFMGARE